jgi:hypothetical protein
VDAGTGIYAVVDGPVVALAAVGEGAGDLFEAWVQREIMSYGVLVADVVNTVQMPTVV